MGIWRFPFKLDVILDFILVEFLKNKYVLSAQLYFNQALILRKLYQPFYFTLHNTNLFAPTYPILLCKFL